MSRKPLTLEDREAIACGIAAGHEGKTIAIGIGRDPSVVSREIGRGGGRSRSTARACAALTTPMGAGCICSARSTTTRP